jgi:hypothetical protein
LHRPVEITVRFIFPYVNYSWQPERLVPFRAKTAQIKALTTLIRIERIEPIERIERMTADP